MHRNHIASKVKASLAVALVADNRTRPMLVFYMYMDTEAMDMGAIDAGLHPAAECGVSFSLIIGNQTKTKQLDHMKSDDKPQWRWKV